MTTTNQMEEKIKELMYDNDMTKSQAMAYYYVGIQDMTLEETGEKMGISRQAVHQHYQAARNKLAFRFEIGKRYYGSNHEDWRGSSIVVTDRTENSITCTGDRVSGTFPIARIIMADNMRTEAIIVEELKYSEYGFYPNYRATMSD